MPLLRRMAYPAEKRFPVLSGPLMNNDFSFSEDTKSKGPDEPKAAKLAKPRYDQSKPLHNLPRGKAWNPPILSKWWFWPAAIGAIIALNLAVTLWERFFGR